jgi:hypothetical protein
VYFHELKEKKKKKKRKKERRKERKKKKKRMFGKNLRFYFETEFKGCGKCR